MQEKSLESTEIFKIFPGEHTPVPPSVSRLQRSLFRSKHFMSPNPFQWKPAAGLSSVGERGANNGKVVCSRPIRTRFYFLFGLVSLFK